MNVDHQKLLWNFFVFKNIYIFSINITLIIFFTYSFIYLIRSNGLDIQIELSRNQQKRGTTILTFFEVNKENI